MADKIPLTDERVVKIEGYFDFAQTYNSVKSALEARNYDVGESSFTEKNDGTSRYLYSIMGDEFTYSDFLKIVMNMKFELKGEEVEVEFDGVKHVFVKGYAKLAIGGFGSADWQEKRKSTPFMTFLAKMTDKFYGKDTFKKLKKKAVDDMEFVISVLRQNMRSNIK